MGSKFTTGALLLALTLMLTLACSGGDSPAAPETYPTQQKLLRTIERMDKEIESLQQEMEKVGGSEEQPTSNMAVTPAASGPGICGRTPIVQEVILQTLRASSCRFVTNEELYRITEFRNLSGDYEGWGQFKAGDLDGLVNLKEMGIAVDFTLPAGTFKGAGISQLSLSGVTLSPGVFEGMVAIGSLSIYGMKEFPTLDAKVFEDLTELTIHFNDPVPDITGDELEHLTNLRQVKMTWELPAGISWEELPQGDDPGREHQIPADLFRTNTLLRSLHMDIDGRGRSDYNFRLSVPHNLVGHLFHLESLSISKARVEGYQPDMAPLKLASDSPLADHLIPPTKIPEGWRGTKQHQDMERWSNWTNGETVSIFSGEDDWLDLGKD